MYMFSLIFFLLISVKKEIYWIWALFVCVNYSLYRALKSYGTRYYVKHEDERSTEPGNFANHYKDCFYTDIIYTKSWEYAVFVKA